jgi:hypothetical protein
MDDPLTHAELVERAERWLRKTRGCSVVLTEMTSTLYETPDAIGWRVSERWSILVEAKADRRDFLRDQGKPHRGGVGLGQERWYLTPPGIVMPEEAPDGWGLLEAHTKTVRTVLRSPRCPQRGAIRDQPVDLAVLANETPLLLSALRRHHCRTCFKDINSRDSR